MIRMMRIELTKISLEGRCNSHYAPSAFIPVFITRPGMQKALHIHLSLINVNVSQRDELHGLGSNQRPRD